MAQGVELGVAYLSIAASTGTFAKDTRAALGDFEGEAARSGQRAGASMGSHISGALSKTLKATAVGAGLVLSAAIGKALVGGFKRLSAIENAEAQMRGLGKTAQQAADIINGPVLKSVQGTAFALDEAGTAAVGAFGAGVKGGKELTSYLSLVGDMAQFANTDFNSMAVILNKIHGQGRLTGDSLLQLEQNGLAASAWLSKAFGVTQEEIRKAVSAGKISAADFEAVMRDKIGGAALKAGETTQGAFRNMMTALSRFGARMLKGLGFDQLKDVFSAITTGLDNLATKLGPVADQVGAFFRDVVGKSTGLAGAFTPFGLLLQTLQPLLPVLTALASQLADTLFPALQSIAGPLQDFATTVGLELANALVMVAPYLAEFAGTLAQIASEALPQLAPLIREAGELFAGLLWSIEPLIPVLADVQRGALKALGWIVSFLLPVAIRQFGWVKDAVIGFGLVLVGAGKVGLAVMSALSTAIGWILDKFAALADGAAAVADAVGLGIGDALRNSAQTMRGWATSAQGNIDAVGASLDTIGSRLDALGRGVTVPINIRISTGGLQSGYGDQDALARHFGYDPAKMARQRAAQQAQAQAKQAAASVARTINDTFARSLPSGGGSTGGGGGGGRSGGSSGASKAVAAAAQAGKSLAQAIGRGFRSSLTGDPKGIRDTMANIAKLVRQAFSGKAEAALLKRVKATTDRLVGLAKRRADVAKRLAQSTSDLSSLRSAKTSAQSAVRDNARGSISERSWSAGGVVEFLKRRVAHLRAFRDAIRVLAKRGLPQYLLNDMINAGPEAAWRTAQNLVNADSATWQAVKSTAKTLESESASFGKEASGLMYDAGIKSAQGLVKGLQSQQKAIEAQMVKIAKAMKKAIQKALKIKSPSRVFRDEVGRQIGLGVIGGVESIRPEVNRSVGGLVDVPRLSSGALRSGLARGGDGAGVYIANLDLRGQSDPVATRAAVVDGFRQLGRRVQVA